MGVVAVYLKENHVLTCYFFNFFFKTEHTLLTFVALRTLFCCSVVFFFCTYLDIFDPVDAIV